MLHFIESIKICNGEIKNLAKHQSRVERAFNELLPNHKPFDIESVILKSIKIPQYGLFKCRIIYDIQPISIEIEPYQQPNIRNIGLINIAKPIDYRHKYLNRDIFNKLRSEHTQFDDIIIAVKDILTDSTFCNIALLEKDRWITPSTPLLLGTKRQELLDCNKIHSELIRVEDLHRFSKITLFNAMNEFNTLSIEIGKLVMIDHTLQL
ncbi:MAG: aminotransferase class IV [Bacteroidales bacterium]